MKAKVGREKGARGNRNEIKYCKGRSEIQGGSKVGIQYIANYCILTVYLLLAHSVYIK